MDKYYKRTFLYVALAILCGILLASGFTCARRHLQTEPQVVEIVRTDTIFKDKPVVVRDTIERYVYVRLPIVQQGAKEVYEPPDSSIENHIADNGKKVSDSVDVIIPITQKEYCDSDYRAWVSGYNASLDSIRIYRTTIERTIAPKRSKLHFFVGAGAAFNSRVEPAVFVGVGWSFHEIRF